MDATASSEAPSLGSVESFIRRWEESGGSEIGNAQPFIKELCTDILGKGEKTRAILLSPETWEALRGLCAGAESEAPVFESAKGAP